MRFKRTLSFILAFLSLGILFILGPRTIKAETISSMYFEYNRGDMETGLYLDLMFDNPYENIVGFQTNLDITGTEEEKKFDLGHLMVDRDNTSFNATFVYDTDQSFLTTSEKPRLLFMFTDLYGENVLPTGTLNLATICFKLNEDNPIPDDLEEINICVNSSYWNGLLYTSDGDSIFFGDDGFELVEKSTYTIDLTNTDGDDDSGSGSGSESGSGSGSESGGDTGDTEDEIVEDTIIEGETYIDLRIVKDFSDTNNQMVVDAYLRNPDQLRIDTLATQLFVKYTGMVDSDSEEFYDYDIYKPNDYFTMEVDLDTVCCDSSAYYITNEDGFLVQLGWNQDLFDFVNLGITDIELKLYTFVITRNDEYFIENDIAFEDFTLEITSASPNLDTDEYRQSVKESIANKESNTVYTNPYMGHCWFVYGQYNYAICTRDILTIKLEGNNIKTTYTVTLDNIDNNGTDKTEYTTGLYTAPTYDHTQTHFFKGWSYENGGELIESWPINVTSDVTLYAVWEVMSTSFVKYYFNGGTYNTYGSYAFSLSVITGDVIPTRSGYVFAGYYFNEDLTGQPITYPYYVLEETSLYAKWISFEELGISSVPTDLQAVLVNNSSLNKDGYISYDIYVINPNLITISEVYYDSNFESTIISSVSYENSFFENVIASEYILNATGGIYNNYFQYVATLNLLVDHEDIEYNSTLSLTSALAYAKDSSSTEYDLASNTVTFVMDIEKTALFELNGGEINGSTESNSITSAIITSTDVVNPTKSGFTFAGWYTNRTFTGSAVDFTNDYELLYNTTFYAKWNVDSSGNSFVFTSDTFNVTTEFNVNFVITMPNEMKAGTFTFLFNLFYVDQDGVTHEIDFYDYILTEDVLCEIEELGTNFTYTNPLEGIYYPEFYVSSDDILTDIDALHGSLSGFVLSDAFLELNAKEFYITVPEYFIFDAMFDEEFTEYYVFEYSSLYFTLDSVEDVTADFSFVDGSVYIIYGGEITKYYPTISGDGYTYYFNYLGNDFNTATIYATCTDSTNALILKNNNKSSLIWKGTGSIEAYIPADKGGTHEFTLTVRNTLTSENCTYTIQVTNNGTQDNNKGTLSFEWVKNDLIYDSYCTEYLYFDVYLNNCSYNILESTIYVFLTNLNFVGISLEYGLSGYGDSDMFYITYTPSVAMPFIECEESLYLGRLKTTLDPSIERGNDVTFEVKGYANYSTMLNGTCSTGYSNYTDTLDAGFSPYLTSVTVLDASNNTLASLSDELKSEFTYTLNGITYSVDKITMNLMFNTGVICTINGTQYTSSPVELEFSINTGINTLVISNVVSGSNSTAEYTFNLVRSTGSSDASRGAFDLTYNDTADTTGTWNEGETEFTFTNYVPYAQRNRSVFNFSANDEFANITVSYNGDSTESRGSIAFEPRLSVGQNCIIVLIESENGDSSNEYKFYIYVEDVYGAAISIDESLLVVDYSGEAFVNPTVTVTANGENIADVSGCTFTYELDGVTLDSNPVNAGTYKLYIYYPGNESVAEAEEVYNVVINRLTITDENINSKIYDYLYSAEDVSLLSDIVITYNGNTLVIDENYTISESDLVNAGEYSVTVTGIGNYQGEITVTYIINELNFTDYEVDYTSNIKDTFVFRADYIKPTFTDLYVNGTLIDSSFYEIVYEDNYAVTTQDVKATITITGLKNITGSYVLSFDITEYSISDAYVLLDTIPEQFYTGANVNVDKVVSLNFYGGSVDAGLYGGQKYTLKSGVDFEIVYPDECAEVGEYDITINGIGNFAGSKTSTIKVVPVTMTDDNTVIELSGNSFTYTGNEITPEVSIYLNGNKLDNEQFNITYGNNIDITEEAYVRIQSTESSAITCDVYKYFTISPINISDLDISIVDSIDYSTTITVSDIVEYIRLVLDADASEEENKYYNLLLDEDYEATVSLPTSGAGTGTILIEALSANYIGNYTDTFTVVARELTEDDIVIELYENTESTTIKESYVFNWSNITPIVKVKIEDNYITEGFSVSYSNNYDVTEEALVTVTISSDKYNGEFTKTFAITPKALSTSMVSPILDRTYTGSPIMINDLEVMDGTNLLSNPKATVPYSYYEIVGYSNNTNIGAAILTLKGINNFSGTIDVSFNIINASIADEENGFSISAEYESVVYNGEVLIPWVKLLQNGEEYDSTQYTITNPESPIDNGTYSIVIAMNEALNYGGSLVFTYTIEKCEINSSMIETEEEEFVLDDVIYNGSQHIVDSYIKLVNGTDELEQFIDYDITYPNGNVEAGTVTVTLTAKSDSNYTGSFDLTFNINKLTNDNLAESDVELSLTLSSKLFEYNYNVQTPDIIVLIGDTKVNDFIVTYEVLEVSGTIDEIDPIYLTNVGTILVNVLVSNNNIEVSLDDSYVISALNIEDSAFNLSDIAPQPYEDLEDGVRPSVTLKHGEYTLVENTDYTLSYENNTNVTTDTLATVIITGIGNYEGELSKEFEIAQAAAGDFTVVLDEEEFIYSGTNIEPTFKVYDGEDLIEDTYYTVGYSNNIDTGEATITITFQENYSGIIAKTFTISPLSIDGLAFAQISNSFAYTATNIDISSSLVIKNGEVELVFGKDYTISYAEGTDNINVGTKSPIIKGIGNYTGEHTDLSYEITPVVLATDGVLSEGFKVLLDFTGIVTKNNMAIFTGSEIEPGASVTLNDIKLQESDYMISWNNNINVGTTASVVILAVSDNVTGSYVATFEITECEITTDNISYEGFSNVVSLKGQPYEFEDLKVFCNGTELVLGTDYEISYYNNDIITTSASFVVVGIGNYSGEITKYFTITETVVAESQITIEALEAAIYTSQRVVPTLVVYIDGVALDQSCYEIVDSTGYENINAGSASVVINLKKGYTGSKTYTYEIAKKDVSSDIVINNSQIAYSLAGLTLTDLDITYGEYKLVQDTDYLCYDILTSVGTTTIKLYGTGNFTGEASFDIEVVALETLAKDFIITINNEDLTYTGSKINPEITLMYKGSELDSSNYTVSVLLEGSQANAIDANIYTLKVVLSDNFTCDSDIVTDFEIEARLISDENVIAGKISPQIYTGEAITVDGQISLKYNSVALVKDTDYEIEYFNNTAQGTATIKVTGIGNYTGEREITFVISEDANKMITIVEGSSFAYIGWYTDTSSGRPKTVLGNIERSTFDASSEEHIVLGNVLPNITISTLLTQLNVSSSLLKVYSNKGVLVEEKNYASTRSGLVTTGMYIEYWENDVLYDRIYISILGDTNGDGSIRTTDVSSLKAFLNDTNSISLEYKFAMDTDKNGILRTTDRANILKHLNGTIDLYADVSIVSSASAVSYSEVEIIETQVALSNDNVELVEEDNHVLEETTEIIPSTTATQDVVETASNVDAVINKNDDYCININQKEE